MNSIERFVAWLRDLFSASASPAPAADGTGGGANSSISHALVLPDADFFDWLKATENYENAFERLVIVRSPAGNDLNRYRNVTAVQTPNVWLNDDALAHIRRIYPSVVRVDIIQAETPAQLKDALQVRVRNSDRYGEQTNSDNHLHDRFVLGWPSDSLPASIQVAFNANLPDGSKNEGLEIYAQRRGTIRAAVGGTVSSVVTQPTALGYGQYVQIHTPFQDTAYLVTYARLDAITVRSGDAVTEGEVIGVAADQDIKLVVQQPGKGLAGYKLPDVIDPTLLIYWNTLRLQPTVDNLRVRKQPGTQFEIIAIVDVDERLETQEPHGRTLVKVGLDDRWLNVRTPAGQVGYAAAWFLQAISAELLERVRLTGVNLDPNHPLGKPSPSRLGNMGWVRFLYNVSYDPQSNTYGNTSLTKAYNRYRPFIEQYARAGYSVILVFTHQTYGEGAGYDWNAMTSKRWGELTAKFAEMAGQIARQYAADELVEAYQIWNEQDAPAAAGASVPMPAGNYAYLLAESIKAIRVYDKSTQIITGGHSSGPGLGGQYARQTIKAMPPGVLPDGIATHPYKRGTKPGAPYAIFGHIDDEINVFTKVLPGAPIWITEFGVLDRPDDPSKDVSEYATSLVKHVKYNHAGKVAAMVWYPWAQGMHNGYGLVGIDDRPRQPLYDDFLKL